MQCARRWSLNWGTPESLWSADSILVAAARPWMHRFVHEMRPKSKTEAHTTNFLAELVCSNSFRSDDMNYNAVGVLHQELRLSNSLIMRSADKNKIPAGSALAVDRVQFSKFIDKEIKNDKNISFINEEVKSLKQFKDTYLKMAS